MEKGMYGRSYSRPFRQSRRFTVESDEEETERENESGTETETETESSEGQGEKKTKAGSQRTGRKMETKVYNIYVNGILNPKDEVAWDVMNNVLTNFFGGRSFHVHNPFLAIDKPEELIAKSVRENPALAFTLGIGILGLSALSFYSSATSKDMMKKAIVLATETILKEQAVKHFKKIARQVKNILTEFEEEEEESGSPNKIHINVFAHSHGGMVLDNFIKSEDLTDLLTSYDNLSLHFIAAGCPILVTKPTHKNTSLKQMHNKNDIISLMLYKSKKFPDYVVTLELKGFHASKLYADNLALCFEDAF